MRRALRAAVLCDWLSPARRRMPHHPCRRISNCGRCLSERSPVKLSRTNDGRFRRTPSPSAHRPARLSRIYYAFPDETAGDIFCSGYAIPAWTMLGVIVNKYLPMIASWPFRACFRLILPSQPSSSACSILKFPYALAVFRAARRVCHRCTLPLFSGGYSFAIYRPAAYRSV